MECTSVDKLVSIYEREGFSFSNFSLRSEANCHPSDSDWNYKDLPHVKYIHDYVEADYAVISDNYLTSIAFQKFFFLKIPISILNYSSDLYSMIYQFSWLFFTIVVETSAEESRPGWTRTTTKYYIGSPKILALLRPIISWFLKRNYKYLMLSDIPMRERRGQLRNWGYSFVGEDLSHSFKKSLDISRSNVIYPKDSLNNDFPAKLSLREILPSDGEYLFGRDDHLGAQIIRSGDMIFVYPRLCPHEGASLDKENYKICSRRREVQVSDQGGYKIMCPWHGRLFEPMAQFDLSSREAQSAESDYLFLTLKEDVVFLDAKILK